MDRGDERQTLCLGGQRLLGLRPLQAESGSITRVQGETPTEHFRSQRPPPTPSGPVFVVGRVGRR